MCSPLCGVSVRGSERKTGISFHSAVELFIITAGSRSKLYPISTHFTDVFAQSSVKFSELFYCLREGHGGNDTGTKQIEGIRLLGH